MVNKFGSGSSGKRGPPGPVGAPGPQGKKGRDGLNFVRWFPNKSVEWFRGVEECSFYFEDKEKDFLMDKGKIIGWKSHSVSSYSREKDAISLKKVEKITALPKRGFCVEFTESLYKVDKIDLACSNNSYAVVTDRQIDNISSRLKKKNVHLL